MNKRDKISENSEQSTKTQINRTKLIFIGIFILIMVVAGAGLDQLPSQIWTFIFILIMVVAGVAVGYMISNDSNQEDINTLNLTNNKTFTLSTNGGNIIKPKLGYSQIELANLKFFVDDKYANLYYKGDYYDTFIGGKDYGNYSEKDDSYFPTTDYARISSYVNDSEFRISISSSKYPEYVNELGNIGNNSNLSREQINIDGHEIEISRTGKDFGSQSLSENMTTAFFDYNGKSIFIVWDGQEYDKYLLESFFQLN
ncbi:hypothetical protein MBCUT_00830 [Methanobrevibacter cuticularis]|uniref:Uncharacterized protein n=1 Tax=Methanobrevibacter cuticularis TaxID=47311 RepID=A0A166FL41_9EURY|nr:hypothetical protein [Methanobrevibacter cuticularis]KZX17788.1 hypothetical protein MBCUT_00830 [Methanobrevibacter cuticularis]